MKKIFLDNERLAQTVAEHIAEVINLTLKSKSRFSLALAGGRTPEKFYKILAEQYKDNVDWKSVDFFWSDERFVPDQHNDSNIGLAKRVLLEPLGIPEENIYLINKDLPITESAQDYSQKVQQIGDFDLVLLGIGADCHTASIFPNQPLVNSLEKNIEAVDYPQVNHLRISFSPKLITEAKEVLVTVTGADKAEAVKKIFSDEASVMECPAKLLLDAKDLTWFIDKNAGALVNV